tara:strand:- start:3303 stop:4106 length:804 start_codon:yes stop_codon:yes gene_type:complete
MEQSIPKNITKFLDELVSMTKDNLEELLVGIYLHGSLAMGCFNPVSSDIDILIVVKHKLFLEYKQAIGASFIKLIEKYSANKIELSIVTLGAMENFQYPTSYELHFSNENIDDFTNGKFDLMKSREDKDLAAHFVIAKNRGMCLYGDATIEVFPDVADVYYLKSITQDFYWSYNNVMNGQDDGTCCVPTYAVLNTCRVLAFIKDGLISSKAEGGAWAIEHLAKEYEPLIAEARKEYSETGTSNEVDAELLKRFIVYAEKMISKSLNV